MPQSVSVKILEPRSPGKCLNFHLFGHVFEWSDIKQDLKALQQIMTEENGTTFELYFPITRDDISDKALSIPIKDYKGNGETILVVDDVKSQRKIASGMLTKFGYSVTTVSSGEEAVEHMENNTAGLLVLDMIMDPGIDGLEAYKRILKVHPGQKAIIASGFSETPRVKETIKLGAGAYVKKPYLIEKIGIAVKSELEK